MRAWLGEVNGERAVGAVVSELVVNASMVGHCVFGLRMWVGNSSLKRFVSLGWKYILSGA